MEDDHGIQALSPDRADDAFNKRTVQYSEEPVFLHTAGADREGAWRSIPIMGRAASRTDSVGRATADGSPPATGRGWCRASRPDGRRATAIAINRANGIGVMRGRLT